MMKQLLRPTLSALFLATLAPSAFADNIANCELVLLEEIKDENGNGGTQVASYRPAADFLADVYTDGAEVNQFIGDLKIRAVMCRRASVIANEADFKVLATGIPFVLSQNFDSAESDLVTYYYKDGEFHYVHKGEDLSEIAQATLDARMANFNERDHDLDAADVEAEDAAAKDTSDETEDNNADTDADTDTEDAAEDKSTKQKPLSLEKRRELE
ncbi:hypothetical protein ACJ3XI_09985 [Litorimonas sp. RW-G-Af-16]|uniref:hypothetical protein n=1 Tax=Litorimonas sp. RW-G-Af-16 TaxID=3241168 RepID=UPI00390C8CA4